MYNASKGERKEKIMVESFFYCSRRTLSEAGSHKVRRIHPEETRLFNYQKERQDETVPHVKKGLASVAQNNKYLIT